MFPMMPVSRGPHTAPIRPTGKLQSGDAQRDTCTDRLPEQALAARTATRLGEHSLVRLEQAIRTA